jgi:hypothetical protein
VTNRSVRNNLAFNRSADHEGGIMWARLRHREPIRGEGERHLASDAQPAGLGGRTNRGIPGHRPPRGKRSQGMNKTMMATVFLCGAIAAALQGQTAVRSVSSTPQTPLVNTRLGKFANAVLWNHNHNLIPVCWETPGYSREKTMVQNAVIGTWGLHANLNFQGWSDCPTQGPARFVRINIGQNGGGDAGADGRRKRSEWPP